MLCRMLKLWPYEAEAKGFLGQQAHADLAGLRCSKLNLLSRLTVSSDMQSPPSDSRGTIDPAPSPHELIAGMHFRTHLLLPCQGLKSTVSQNAEANHSAVMPGQGCSHSKLWCSSGEDASAKDLERFRIDIPHLRRLQGRSQTCCLSIAHLIQRWAEHAVVITQQDIALCTG